MCKLNNLINDVIWTFRNHVTKFLRITLQVGTLRLGIIHQFLLKKLTSLKLEWAGRVKKINTKYILNFKEK